MEKIKILELFGGIGACSKALERLGIDYEIADYVEIDKYAVASFNAMHNTNFEPQDICEWDKDIDVDLVMHGSPCQDFSLAGLQAGGDENSGTRSSLMYETIRIVEKLKPKYVIWENVKNLISKKHIHNFNNYIEKMNELGYTSYYQVLNAKDYGIPQNRERVFTISIKNDNPTIVGSMQEHASVRDDGISPTLTSAMGMGGGQVPLIIQEEFNFPPKKELKLKLKDMLEDEVEEKYYLSEQAILGRQSTHYQKYKLEENIVNDKEIHPTILARFEGAPTLVVNNKDVENDLEIKTIGNYSPSNHNASRIVDSDGIAPTVMENHGTVTATNVYSKSEEQLFTEDGNIKRYINSDIVDEFKEGQMATTSFPNGYGHGPRTHDESVALNTIDKPSVKHNLRIRKLTPKECWRLMGFDDSDFEKASKVCSNSQLYKQAGNSIVVNVLEEILKELLCKKN